MQVEEEPVRINQLKGLEIHPPRECSNDLKRKYEQNDPKTTTEVSRDRYSKQYLGRRWCLPTKMETSQQKNADWKELNEPKILDWSEAVKEAPQVDSNYCRLSEEENANHNNEDADNASDIKLTALKQLEQDIEMQRAGARVAQKPYGQKFQ
uniref:Uncharacterized protein n=1 Tax=Acrobeloides nanus TaxID=290746 RepID=A0A914DWH0_9BILA